MDIYTHFNNLPAMSTEGNPETLYNLVEKHSGKQLAAELSIIKVNAGDFLLPEDAYMIIIPGKVFFSGRLNANTTGSEPDYRYYIKPHYQFPTISTQEAIETILQII